MAQKINKSNLVILIVIIPHQLCFKIQFLLFGIFNLIYVKNIDCPKCFVLKQLKDYAI